MEKSSRNEEVNTHLLDLWKMKKDEQKLELSLAPPGDEDWSMKIFSSMASNEDGKTLSLGFKSNTQIENQMKTPFLKLQSNSQTFSAMGKESSQLCCTKMAELQNAERKAFSPSSVNTAVPNSSQKRTAPGPVVGWPPIRSFRKNLASSSSKPSTESQNVSISNKVGSEKQPIESCTKGLFVKINMDGVPIGRKVDINAYNSYEKLSNAADELFRGLIAAQRDSSSVGFQKKQEDEKVITGMLDGSGEYTLVYEDNEGDRMLVGDVPWHMFVSTVKRLRVLKSSELSSLSIGSNSGKKVPFGYEDIGTFI